MSEPKNARRRRVCVRFSNEEHLALVRRAAESGYTESELIRKATLGVAERKRRIPLQENAARFYELAIALRTMLEKLRHENAFQRQEIVNCMDNELRALQKLAISDMGVTS